MILQLPFTVLNCQRQIYLTQLITWNTLNQVSKETPVRKDYWRLGQGCTLRSCHCVKGTYCHRREIGTSDTFQGSVSPLSDDQKSTSLVKCCGEDADEV